MVRVTDPAAERDLYRALLGLVHAEDAPALLRSLLPVLLDATGARQAYLELSDPDVADEGEVPRWSVAHDCDDRAIRSIRVRLSRGILGEAIATGRVVRTGSARTDARFRDRESVVAQSLGAVLCGPIGAAPVWGALYLEGDAPFTEAHEALIATVTQFVAPLAERLLARARRDRDADHTRAIRRRLQCDGIVGRSAALARTLEQIGQVADVDMPVLLTGPSGAGKTLLARVLHANSQRAAGPFVELNAAALPDALAESELFGAVRGAHSTATRELPGKLAAADGGTLFLDEVAELSPRVQSMLLQFLEGGVYHPLGSPTARRADVRLICATNSDLDQAVTDGTFRRDLLFRIRAFPIAIPSLAERPEDVPELARAMLRDAAARYGTLATRLSPGATRVLRLRAWPGNVRELRNVVLQAAVRARGEVFVEAAHLDPTGAPAPEPAAETFHASTRAFQRDLLRRTLEATRYNVAEAARRLDLSRSHLYTLIDQLQVPREA
ncbi:MAG: transcriptional regulator with GAF, ATPase, and Fis domain [Myxococcota bacterium]|jgi:transcriptional regulator with GAF, ATPase, and Fis domain